MYYLLFMLLLIAPVATSYISVFSSVDEIVAIFGVLAVFNNYVLKKSLIAKNVFYLILSMVLIGIISSVISKISPSVIVSCYDVLLFLKPFVIFLVFYNLTDNVKKDVIDKLNVIAKAIFIFIFVYFAVYTISGKQILSSVFPMLGNMAQLSWLRVVCLNIIAIANSRDISKRYIVLFYVSLFTSGIGGFSSALFTSLTVFLYLYRENKERKLRIWQVVFLGMVAIVFAYSDLKEYIFNENAPRALLVKYGFRTANSYFPLGSGFASYGSEMAKRYYSKLYYIYGFNNIWSMSPENNLPGSKNGTLNDCYLGMIVGQFGWFGFLCYIYLMYSIYKLLREGSNNTYSKAILISTLITILSSIMVSNNTSSHFGICMYAIMGLASFRKSIKNDLEIHDTGVLYD